MRLFFFIFVFFLTIFPLFSETHRSLVWKCNSEQSSAVLDDIPEHFFVREIEYSSDTQFTLEDFTSLCGFKKQSWQTRAQLLKTLHLCGATKRFDHAVITYSSDQEDLLIGIELVGCWRLSKVRCKTNLLGKDKYRHAYRIAQSEVFDTIRHEDSLRSIREMMHEIGYLDAEVIDIIEYDQLHKTVAVTLILEPKQPYTISKIEMRMQDQSLTPPVSLMLAKMKRRAVKELYGVLYVRDMVTHVQSLLEEIALHEGFLQVSSTVTSVPDHEKQQVDLIFDISLKELVHMHCIGNHFFTTKQLFERLMLFDGALSLLPVSLLLDEISEYYKEYGFWGVSIACQEEENRLIFCIKEGPRVTLKNMIISGASYFTIAQIRAWGSGLLDAPYFEKQKQRAFRACLLQEYRRAGFWDCVIEQEKFTRIGSSEAYCYQVTIAEGMQRFLRSVTIDGLSDAEKKGQFSAYYSFYETPLPFDLYFVQEQRRLLLADLHRNGYLYAHPKPILKENEGGVIDVVWQIDNPQKVYCDAVVLAGMTRLSGEYITRELTFGPGGLITKAALDRSVAQLKKLSIFDQVSLRCVETLPNINQNAADHLKRDVIISCIDDDPFEVRVRAGMQFIGSNIRLIDLGARYGGSLLWKNPLNRADRIQVDFDSSPHLRYGQAVYSVPWLGSIPVKTNFSLYGSRFDEPLFYCFRERLYRLTQDGCAVEFEKDQITWQWGLICGIESMKISCIARHLAALINFKPSLVDQRMLYGIIEPCLLTRGVDDLINPTRGTLFSCFARAFIPLQSRGAGFFKIVAEESIFMPVFKTMVGAIHFRIGHMFLSDFVEIMPSERFYLGGAYSLRGYGTDMAPPVNACRPSNKFCLLPIGGKTILSTMCELRFPIYKALGGVIFTDCGTLAQNDFWQHNIVGATGFGLRYATPVGALRFDIAWNWSHKDNSGHPFAWFLTLGQAF